MLYRCITGSTRSRLPTIGRLDAARAYKGQEPVEQSREPVLEPRHESNMHDEPDKPCDSAGEPNPMRAEDGATTVDSRQNPSISRESARHRF